MNIEKKRELLDRLINEEGTKGRFCSVTFYKNDGTERKATIKRAVERLYSSGDKTKVQANTVAHINKYYSAVDIHNDKWININLETLSHIKGSGKEYSF